MQVGCIGALHLCIMEKELEVHLRLQGRKQLADLMTFIASQEMTIYYKEMVVKRNVKHTADFPLGSWHMQLFLTHIEGDVIRKLYDIASYSIHPTDSGFKFCFNGLL